VQILVEHHGGTVLARSEGVGKGSEFVVSLPLAVSPLPKTADQHPNRLVQDSPRRILIVDDNEDAANSIGKLLRKFGHEVQIAYDGIAALEEAKAFAPEVVLLDLGLPILDGYETARRLRSAVPDRNKLLLIALSGYGQEEDRRRAMEAGFDHHLVKPFDTHELRALLNAWTPDRS
jgi:CheY-like chemotaxis protein